MPTEHFAKIIAESWPSIVGILFGTTIAHIFTYHRRSDIRYVRRLLGRALNRFATVPASVLDPELLSAARRWHSGSRGVVAFLAIPTLFCIAMLSASVLRDTAPQLSHPGLVSALLCGLIVGVGIWLFQSQERRFILHHLDRLHPMNHNR